MTLSRERPAVVDRSRIPFYETSCDLTRDQIQEHVRSALTRGLKELRRCKPHGLSLAVVAGGPSAEDTYTLAKKCDRIATVNGSHDWLLSKGIVPHYCAVLDGWPIVADLITPHPAVTYFIASMAHPKVFDKLRGFHVVLWHASADKDKSGLLEVLQERQDREHVDLYALGGGSTMALRWLNLGAALGFRHEELHGFDSSYRGRKHHAYDQPTDDAFAVIPVDGYPTRHAWLAQISDFMAMLETMKRSLDPPMTLEVHGDGLFQAVWRDYQNKNPNAFKREVLQ